MHKDMHKQGSQRVASCRRLTRLGKISGFVSLWKLTL